MKQFREAGEVFTVPAGHKIKGVSALVDAKGRETLKREKTIAKVIELTAIVEAVVFAPSRG